MSEIREPLVFSVSGQKVFATVHHASKPRAAALILHGFGGNKVGYNRLFVLMAEALTARDISCLRFDFRGAGDSEGAFEETTLQGLLQDAEAARREAEKLHSKVALIGTSMGGLLSALLAQKRAAASMALWAPVFDASQWREQWKEMIEPLPTHLPYRGRMISTQFLQQFFALESEAALQGVKQQPTFFVRGGKDETLTKQHWERYRTAAYSSRHPTEFLELVESDHPFTNVAERDILIRTTADWVERFL